MNAFRAALTALVVSALLVTGCGGGDEATTTSAASTTTTPAVSGTAFTDPAGKYTITIDPEWTAGTTDAPKLWYLPQGTTEFGDNVNVVTENIPSGIDIDEYVEAALKNAPGAIGDFTLKSQERLTLPSGQPGARLRFSGSVAGRGMEFLQVVALADGSHVVVVTLTAPTERIESDITAAEPFMRTVVATT